MDLSCLNCQVARIRNKESPADMSYIHTQPLCPEYHAISLNKMVLSSVATSTLSTKVHGEHRLLPGAEHVGKVFAAQEPDRFVAGEFFWPGFDHMGGHTPYYTANSSNSGIISHAGFKKIGVYQYQSAWKPERRPHLLWSDRVGCLVTPLHVFSVADSVEIFVD
ncbi:beta-galactosidase [Diaporthe helianthi]|uniref:Beta-galactosidase n=1 Tax=Diaporthe helianthi TaxID=158607 RepID=A0A2P5HR35_DIAHE|nr:beta-galactosidase [Diaporthe helianthi]